MKLRDRLTTLRHDAKRRPDIDIVTLATTELVSLLDFTDAAIAALLDCARSHPLLDKQTVELVRKRAYGALAELEKEIG